MFEITSYRPTASEDLATLLLGDDSVARNYVLIAKMIMMHSFIKCLIPG